MPLIGEIFELTAARSRDTKSYDDGPVPFVTSAETDNGIVRHVTPKAGDRVFEGPCVVLSGLGHASVHLGPVLPKGNGGDACTVARAREGGLAEHFAFAAAFNVLHAWRFSYGRKCNVGRLSRLAMPWPLPAVHEAWREEQARLTAEMDALARGLRGPTR